MGIESLTFDQYLDADAAAQKSEEGKLAFGRLQKELDDLPGARQRLAFEMVVAGLKFVGEKAEIGPLSGWIFQWSKYVDSCAMIKFMDLVENLTIQYFKSFEGFELSFPELTLPVLLSTVRENEPARLEDLMCRLRTEAQLGSSSIKTEILDGFEQSKRR